MIIKCFSFSFNRGGAAIAAKNISLLAKKFADVKCYCADSSTIKDIDVVTPGRFEKYGHFFKRVISRLLLLLMNDHNNNKHSLNMFSSKTMVAALQEQVRGDSTVSHIHWIANDAISIFDLEKLPKNTLISLHDEWFYMGTEHVSMNNPVDRFKDGYEYRPSNLIGIDLNKIAWKQKYKIFSNRNDVIVTAPSSWMVNRAKESLMFRNNEIRLLPNPIDTECFSPITNEHKVKVRREYKINDSDIVIIFGAVKVFNSRIKGLDLLKEALLHVKSNVNINKIKIIVFGDDNHKKLLFPGFTTINVGYVDDRTIMSILYGISDFLVMPSMLEAFGMAAAESLACETPVICFRCTGLTDIVLDEESGFLVEPFDTLSLGGAIINMLSKSNEFRKKLGKNGRQHVISHFSNESVGKRYKEILNEVMT